MIIYKDINTKTKIQKNKENVYKRENVSYNKVRKTN